MFTRSGKARPEGVFVKGTWTDIVFGFIVARYKFILMILLALFLVGLGAYFAVARPPLSAFANWGYLGILVVTFLSSTTIIFPAPGFLAVVAAGIVLNPALVALAAGIGGGLGEFSSYLLGLGGENLLGLQSNPRWQLIHTIVRRYGFWAVVVAAATPLPFDVVGFIAGSTGYPASRFIVATVIGKVIKYAILAYFGDIAVRMWGEFGHFAG